jgi:hypothetical protein
LNRPIRVELAPLDGERFIHLPSTPFVNDDGSFTLTDVIPRPYQVAVAGNGLPGDGYLASAQYNGRSVIDGGIMLDDAPPGVLELTIARGGTVEGNVHDAKGDPVPDTRVVLIPPTSRSENITLYKTEVTDQYGKFTIHGVAPGAYGVLAWNQVAPNAWLNSSFLRDFGNRAAKVVVYRNSTSNVNVRLIVADH